MPAPRHSLPPHAAPPFHSSGQGRGQQHAAGVRNNEPQRILEAQGIRRCDAVPISEAWGLYGFRAAGQPGGHPPGPAPQVSQLSASHSDAGHREMHRGPSPRGDGFGGLVQRGGSLRAVTPPSAPPSHLRSAVLSAGHMPPQPHHGFRSEQQRRQRGPSSQASTAAMSQRSGGSAYPPAAAPPVRSASMTEARTAMLIRKKVAAAREGVDMDNQPSRTGSASSGSSYNSQTSWRSGVSLRPGQLLPSYPAPSFDGSRRSSLLSMHAATQPPGPNLMTAQQRYGSSPSPHGALGLLNMSAPPPSSSGRASPPAPSPVAVWRQSLPFASHRSGDESTSPPRISAKERIARMHLSQLPLVGPHPTSQLPTSTRHSSHHLPRMPHLPHLHMPRSLQKLSSRSHSTRDSKSRSISGPIAMSDFSMNPFRRSLDEDARRRSMESEASDRSPGSAGRAREKAQRKTLSDALGPPSSDDEGPYAICKAVGEEARRNSKGSDASAGNTPRPDAQARGPNGFGFVSRWGEDVHASQQRQQAMRLQQQQQQQYGASPTRGPALPFSGTTPPRGMPLYAPQARMQAPPNWSNSGPVPMRNPFDQPAPAPMLWQQPGVPQRQPRRGSVLPANLPQRPQFGMHDDMLSPREGAVSQQGSWLGGPGPRMPTGGRRGSASPWQGQNGGPPPGQGRRGSVSRQQGNAGGQGRGRGATTPQQGSQYAQQQVSGRRGSVSQRQQQGGPSAGRGPPPPAGQRRGSALPRYVPPQGSGLMATAAPFVPGSQIPRRNGAEGSAIPAPMGLAGRVRNTSQASQQRIRRPSVAANFLPATPRSPSAKGRRPSYSNGGMPHPGMGRRRSSSGAGRYAQEPGMGRRRNGSISYQPPPPAGGRRRGSSVSGVRSAQPSPSLASASWGAPPPMNGRQRGNSVGQQAMPPHVALPPHFAQAPSQATPPVRPVKSPQRQESPPLISETAASSRSNSRESERPHGPTRAPSSSSTIRFGPRGTTGTTEGSLTPTVRAASTSLPDDAGEDSDDEEDAALQHGTALLRQQVRVADPSPSIFGGEDAASSVGEYNGVIEVGFDRSPRRKSYLSIISSGDSVDTACEEERVAPSPPPMAATRASLPAVAAPVPTLAPSALRRTPSAPRAASMSLLKRNESIASTRSEDEAGRLWKHLESRLGVDLTTGAKKSGYDSPSSSRASSKLVKRRSITRTRSPESPWALVESALGELKLSLGKVRQPSPVPPVPPLPERVLESQDPGLRYAASDDEPLEEASTRSSRSNSLTGDKLDSSLTPTLPDVPRASSALRASLPAVADSSSRIPIFTRSTRPLSEARNVRAVVPRTKQSLLPTRTGLSANNAALPAVTGRQRMDSASSLASSLMTTTSSSPSRSQRSFSDGLTESDTDVSDLGSESGRRRSQTSSSHSRLPRRTPRTPRNGEPLLPASSKQPFGGLEAQSPVALALTALRSSTIRRAERDQLDMYDFGRATESEYVGKPTAEMRQHAAARLEIQARRALS